MYSHHAERPEALAPDSAPGVRLAPEAAGGPPPSGPSAMGILQGLRRGWLKAAVLGTFLAAAAAFGAYVLLEPKYTAVAQVHVGMPDNPLGMDTLSANRSDYLAYQKLQASWITSPFVFNM